MKIGSHISIKNGYFQAAKTAYAYGASCFQYFPKNPRALGVKEFDQTDARMCMEFCKEHDITSVAHTSYPTDLTPPLEKETIIVDSLLNDLDIANSCSSIGVVVHFGSRFSEKDPLEGYKKMIEMLNKVIMKWDGKAKILLENNPGTMGTTFEEMVKIRSLVSEPNKIGFCLDTCHLFVSGEWTGDNWKELEERGNKEEYFHNLVAVHLNDAKFPSGSRIDRHENIGKGYIPKQQFQQLMSSPFLKNIPFILETPKQNNSHEQEIREVMHLFKAYVSNY